MPVEEVIFSFAKIGIENPLVQSLGIALIRASAGWLENAFKDGKITRPELMKFGETLLRVLPQALGLAAFGVPAVGALATDILVTKAAKLTEKKKR